MPPTQAPSSLSGCPLCFRPLLVCFLYQSMPRRLRFTLLQHEVAVYSQCKKKKEEKVRSLLHESVFRGREPAPASRWLSLKGRSRCRRLWGRVRWAVESVWAPVRTPCRCGRSFSCRSTLPVCGRILPARTDTWTSSPLGWLRGTETEEVELKSVSAEWGQRPNSGPTRCPHEAVL